MNNSEYRRISVSDSTLRFCGSYTFKEKLETVRLLGKLGIDALEFGRLPDGDKSAALLCRTAGALLPPDCVLSVDVTGRESADAAAAALSSAPRARLTVSLPLSTVQAEYLYHKKPAAMIGMIGELIKYASELIPDVAFRAGDATRAEPGILAAAAKAAKEAGASLFVICDDSGETLPDETAACVKAAAEAAPGLEIGIEASDRLGLAAASALAAVEAGAGCVSCSMLPGAVPSVAFAGIVAARGSNLGISIGTDTTMLGHTAGRIAAFAENGRSGRTPFENGAGGDPGVGDLPADADIDAVSASVRAIGYELDDADRLKVFESFRELAAKSGRKTVGARELDAIVAQATGGGKPVYRLEAYVINSGNMIAATAHVTLVKEDGTKLVGFCVGDGPIDASFLAIEQIIGHHYELDDFQIRAVTEGREAMGDALVRLRADGRLYSGKGLSTDIIGASITAYVNALNKIAGKQNSN
ncbi:MAG: hypothetical protein K5647_10100 [Clostridiales bacterium]|nr:hypothetical protein [Clostridiales bacterium]